MKNSKKYTQTAEAALQDRLDPVLNSVACQIIQRGLKTYSQISNVSVAPPYYDLINNKSLQHIAIPNGPEFFLELTPNGEIELNQFWVKNPGHVTTSLGSLNNTVAHHWFGADEVVGKDAAQQVLLAREVLSEIGAAFASASPAFKTDYNSALEAVIRQSYEELGIAAPPVTAKAGSAALRVQEKWPLKNEFALGWGLGI